MPLSQSRGLGFDGAERVGRGTRPNIQLAAMTLALPVRTVGSQQRRRSEQGAFGSCTEQSVPCYAASKQFGWGGNISFATGRGYTMRKTPKEMGFARLHLWLGGQRLESKEDGLWL